MRAAGRGELDGATDEVVTVAGDETAPLGSCVVELIRIEQALPSELVSTRDVQT